MSSASSQIRLAGLCVLVESSGEWLKFGNLSVAGLVNRAVKKPRDGISSKDGRLDFSIMGMSEIEIPFENLAQPAAGNTFIDEIGFRHRVEYVTNTDISWVVYCSKSKT